MPKRCGARAWRTDTGCCCPMQIVVLTYPLIGNYGVPDQTLEDVYGETNPPHAQALVRTEVDCARLIVATDVQVSSRMASPARCTSRR